MQIQPVPVTTAPENPVDRFTVTSPIEGDVPELDTSAVKTASLPATYGPLSDTTTVRSTGVVPPDACTNGTSADAELFWITPSPDAPPPPTPTPYDAVG